MIFKRKKKILLIVFCTVAIIVFAIIGFYVFTQKRINKIPQMTFNDMIMYTTNNNEKAIIAIGIIKNGKTNITLYGKNGNILQDNNYVFEIGSITKTFTASLLSKAIIDGKIDIDANISNYLELPKKDYYPTIRRLITHTSGYRSYYFDMHMMANYFLKNGNIFFNITKSQLIEQIGKIDLKDMDYEFKYSNFGIAIIGTILSEVYRKNFSILMNEFIEKELYLAETKIYDGSGNLEKYWDWVENDAYIPAGALISTIKDMVKYSQLQMDKNQIYLLGTHGIGMTWILDKHNNIIWHNGGTGDFNSYLGFDPVRNISVVVLSNLPPNYRIPATLIGIKLLTDLQKEEDKLE